MIIWLASWPRSGNTLVRTVLCQVMGFKTYSIYLDRDLYKMGAHAVVGHEGQVCHNHVSYIAHMHMNRPIFVKTHDKPIDGDLSRAIHIIRDPRAAIWSYAHYRRDIDGCTDDFDDILTRLITGNRFGGWSGHAEWWKAHEGYRFVVKFEALVEDGVGSVSAALDSMGIAYEVKGSMPTFDELHAKWPKFFRKGTAGSWKGNMPKWAVDLIRKRHGDVMEQYGYG